jgi:hypothetical protein
MNTRLALIRQQRALLQLRAGAQRLALIETLRPWSRPLTIADLLVTGLQQLRRHPLMVGVMLLTMISTPRHRLGIWLSRMLTVWEIIDMWRRQRARDAHE